MPKEYRRGKPAPPSPPSTPSPRRKQNRSCVWWLVVGVALGVVGTKSLAPRESTMAGTDSPAASSQAPTTQPTFMFEKILSGTEVEVGKLPPPPPPAPRPQPPAAPPLAVATPVAEPTAEPAPTPPVEPLAEPRSGTYVVQVGSFSRTADAERLRAQLAQLGISTGIQSATLPNGKTTHRVRTGAYASKQEAEKIRSVLKSHGKDSLTIPIK